MDCPCRRNLFDQKTLTRDFASAPPGGGNFPPGRGRAGTARGLVPAKRPRPPLAAGADALPGVGVGDHAPADPGGGGQALLPAVSGGPARHPRPRRRAGGAALKALGGPRLLQPRPQPAKGRPADHGAVRRGDAALLRAAARPGGVRGIYGRGGGVYRIRHPGPGGGRQRPAGLFPAAGGRERRARPRRPQRVPAASACGYAAGPPRRLQPVPDGAGGDPLCAERPAAVRGMPACPPLPGICRREPRGLPGEIRQKGAPGRGKDGLCRRLPGGRAAPQAPGRGAAGRAVGIPLAAAALAGWGIAPQKLRALRPAKHLFTHIEWRMDGFLALCGEFSPPEGTALARWEELEAGYALPSAFAAFKKAALAAKEEFA